VRALALLAASAAASLACLGSGTSAHAGGCWAGWSYNGVQSPTKAYGVSARLTLAAPSSVSAGHTAAWVGVGGPGLGPHGADEWVQAGFADDAGGSGDVLYYEFKRPGDPQATYTTLGPVAPGSSHSVSVFESATRNSWRVRIDGLDRALVVLPGSHDAFAPVATAENWDGGVGSCNTYSYSFGALSVRPAYTGAWRPFSLTHVLRDPAYALAFRATGFAASSR
jgi:hypothetical protein